jgi:hypothetical protein
MENNITLTNLNQQISTIGHNPFLEVPNPNCATEYKKGYVMRKSCYECNGKKSNNDFCEITCISICITI